MAVAAVGAFLKDRLTDAPAQLLGERSKQIKLVFLLIETCQVNRLVAPGSWVVGSCSRNVVANKWFAIFPASDIYLCLIE